MQEDFRTRVGRELKELGGAEVACSRDPDLQDFRSTKVAGIAQVLPMQLEIASYILLARLAEV